MVFRISKFAVLSMKHGKKSADKHIVLPTGESMIEPDEDGYKYLGILEVRYVAKMWSLLTKNRHRMPKNK